MTNQPKRSNRFPAQERGSADWLLLVLTLQGAQGALRMRVWRALKAIGAAVLRDGVYLLPNRPPLAAGFRAQAADVMASGGSAQVLTFNAAGAAQEAEFRQLFDRTAEYAELAQEIAETRSQIETNGLDEGIDVVARLRRQLEALLAQDFFPGEPARQAAQALDELDEVAIRAASPDEPHSAHIEVRRLVRRDYRRRTWATRARPWVDRLASAWLIRRFIDPEARFIWLKKPADCPKRALGFDFDGAVFTHVDGKVTFEVLMESFDLGSDPALRDLGAVVHYLDVGGIPVPEAAGVESLLRAARAAFENDDILLQESMRIFELLYRDYGARRTQANTQ